MFSTIAQSRRSRTAALLAGVFCLTLNTLAQAQYEAPAQQIPTFAPGETKEKARPLLPPPPQLRGLAEFTTISAQALEVRPRLFPDCRMTGFTCINVAVKNKGSQLVTVHGDKAQAIVSGKLVIAASDETLVKRAGCGMSAAETALLWGVGLASVGLAGPILEEILTEPKYPQAPYGVDAVRKRIEGDKLGRRLLLPGDETAGWLCFQSQSGEVPLEVLIPANSATQSGRVAVRMMTSRSSASPEQ